MERDTFDFPTAPTAFAGHPGLLGEWNRSLGDYLGSLDDVELDDDATITGLPYDSCNLCLAREAMAFLIPRVLLAAGDGLLEVTER